MAYYKKRYHLTFECMRMEGEQMNILFYVLHKVPVICLVGIVHNFSQLHLIIYIISLPLLVINFLLFDIDIVSFV